MAWVSQTPQRPCSQYALIPISGALMPSAIEKPPRPGRSQGCHIRAGDPAIDQELRRGDKRRVVAGEECYRCGYLLRLGEPANGMCTNRRAARSGSLAYNSRSSGVFTGPGHSALTLMPSRANCTPSSRVMASTPPLDAV